MAMKVMAPMVNPANKINLKEQCQYLTLCANTNKVNGADG
jgi:hypothetical protein